MQLLPGQAPVSAGPQNHPVPLMDLSVCRDGEHMADMQPPPFSLYTCVCVPVMMLIISVIYVPCRKNKTETNERKNL